MACQSGSSWFKNAKAHTTSFSLAIVCFVESSLDGLIVISLVQMAAHHTTVLVVALAFYSS